MSQLRKEFRLLRALKGAPMSILFAFQTIDTSMYPNMLCVATGYPTDEILSALFLLSEMGLAVEHPDGKWAERVTIPPHESTFPAGLICPN